MADKTYAVPARVAAGAHLVGEQAYADEHALSTSDNAAYWAAKAREYVDWFQPFTKVSHGSFADGDIAWFLHGKLNVAYNCVDRHVLAGRGDRVAIIWEGDDPDVCVKVTYKVLLQQVCRLSNALLRAGVGKGDTVAIYLPNCPEAAYAMLACARIGAIHSVIFAGFSAEALAQRINDCSSKVLLTADEFYRGGRVVGLKKIADDALTTCPTISTCFVLKRTGNPACGFVEGRDQWMQEAMDNERPYCAPVALDSEDTLFLLYTSGSTGKPKGMVHTQAGYLLYAAVSHKLTFDYREGDVYACVADVGWITGHSYIVYGPLANGATTFMFESTPLYPDASRYWQMCERHQFAQFYTAPTAIRALQKFGDAPVKATNRSSLRVLGTVGEPINPEAWLWYFNVVGERRCAIVDTYWQTESGGHLLTPLPACTPTKPGAATLPFFGQEFELMDAATGKPIKGNNKTGILCASRPWPSIARTIYGDHQRYLKTYMTPYPGYYFTGDRATRDGDGYLWIGGRVDDVINVSGHRIGTAEIEAALAAHPDVAEAAVVAVPHDIKGQGIFAYAVLNADAGESDNRVKELKQQVRKVIGPFATPDCIVICEKLPKTRSGKIMRRILRKIASNEHNALGDISTLADPSAVEHLIGCVAKVTAAAGKEKK